MGPPRSGLAVAVFLVLMGSSRLSHESKSYGFRDDDYYQDFYLRRVPKLKVSPDKVKQFFRNHLSWFPLDDFLESNKGGARLDHWQEHRGTGKFKHSLKNFTECHKGLLKGNFTALKNDTEKLKNAINKVHLRGKLKNITHPFRPKPSDHPPHTTVLKYMTSTTTTTASTEPYHRPCLHSHLPVMGPPIRIHKKSGAAVSAPRKGRWVPPHPRKLRVVIDLDSPGKKRRFDKHFKQLPYEMMEPNNSSHVLETAEEMATDLAGRVTNLWKCVVRSHRNPEVRDVKYYLYTRRNVIEPEVLSVNYDLIRNRSSGAKPSVVDCAEIVPEDIGDFKRVSDEHRSIIKSNFLSLRSPTKILIHGYTGSYKDSRMSRIKDEYLSRGRYNVIQVDWEMLAAPPCYIRVTHHSRFVGETVAKFIDGLYLIGMNMSLVHLIGFSLGAQVAGFAGNMVAMTKVCRITGLDPALPLFLHTDPSGHLDKSDAYFVDVIHTCGGILAMYDPLGHVDFYPNGGSRQPGCEFSNLKCSHSRAPQYFAESVSSKKKFTAQMCPSWDEYVSGDCNSSLANSFMGEPCSFGSSPGKYYLTTRSKEPFVV